MNKDKLVIVERLREQRREYENTPNGWAEEKEEVVDPELWTEAADTIEALYEGLAANVRELRVMLPLIHHASTRNDIAAVVEQGEEAIALARGEQP